MHQTSQPHPASENTWKKAVIIGGMVGASLLMGAVVLRAQLPGWNGSTATPQVEPSIASSPAPTKPTSQPAAPAQSTAPIQQAPEASAAEAPVQSAPSRPIDTSNTNAEVVGAGGSKNVRAGAGINYNIVETVQPGDRVRILDTGKDTKGDAWFKVYIPRTDSQGWVSGQFIQSDDAPPAQADKTDATIIGAAGSKNIRSGPGTNFEVKHVAYPGDRVEILDSDQDQGGFTWYEVSFPQSGAKGWIAAQLVKRD